MTDLTADQQIASCLTLGSQLSFMLKAGAGSGKTSSLVTSVEHALQINGPTLALTGARIAVITYTRAARDEIKSRLNYDNRVSVSTIHSFAWELIRHHSGAIKALREVKLTQQILDLKEKESRGRGGAASADRLRKIERNSELLRHLPSVRAFQYSPDRDVPGHGELNHHEVIELFAELLQTKPLLAQILVGRFPILFIDEVQDTAKSVIPSLLQVERENEGLFTLGFFGDMMQRIYLDGVSDLPSLIPHRWILPQISVNHRSGSRIVDLANSIRQAVDTEVQTADQTYLGIIRLFIADATSNRFEIEKQVRDVMNNLTSDALWHGDASGSADEVKVLVLEHALAASRLGFREFSDCFTQRGQKDALYGQSASTNPRTSFLGKITSLLVAIQSKQLWRADNLLASLRSESYRFREGDITGGDDHELNDLDSARSAARKLMALVLEDNEVSLLQLLIHIRHTQLFALPEFMVDILDLEDDSILEERLAAVADPPADIDAAWLASLHLSWKQFQAYYDYISGRSSIDTQQGVKGLEFERVMLVLDDSESNGNLFSYEKLLGTKQLSSRDQANITAGKESSIDRTRRLLYVSCTRAIKSLAIVYYTTNPDDVHANSQIHSWFTQEEIEVITHESTAFHAR